MNSENGGYDLQGCIWHTHSNRLLIKILELWVNKNIPIIDFGCGHNFYMQVLTVAGYKTVGIDSVDMRSKDFILHDVTKPIYIGFGENSIINSPEPIIENSKANILSLEVGEHLPYDKCFGYLDNLTSFGGDVIMSWAVPGQAGHNHINCQSNLWVISQMSQRGYNLDAKLTDELREAVKDCSCTWFKNTLLYFRPS